MDIAPLTDSPNLEQYESLASDLVEAYRSGDPAALQRLVDRTRRKLTWDQLRAGAQDRLNRLSGPADRGTGISLAEARLLIARLHGFEGWPELTNYIEAVNREGSAVRQFENVVDAVVTGDLELLDRLLRENTELIRMRSTRLHHATLLHYVSANGVEDFRQKSPKNSVETADRLLKGGAEVDAVLADGQSTTLGLVATSVHPLLAGVQIGLLETLLRAGAAVDGVTGGWNPVLAALANGRGGAAAFLATNGARLDLEGAAGVGRLDAVQSFFNDDGTLKDSATREQMKSGFTWACEYGRTSVVEFLLDSGMELDAKLRHNGQTGLHWAAYCGRLETVKLLLHRNAPVNPKDESFDGTPLGWALYGWAEPAAEGDRAHYYEVVALLVDAGATVEPEWLHDAGREGLGEKVRADVRILAALGR